MPRGLPSPSSAVRAPGRRGLSPLGAAALLLTGGCQALSGLSDYDVTGAGGGASSTSTTTMSSASGGGNGEGGAGGAACVPAAEVCGNDLDEDCDAVDCSATLWASALGGAVFQVPYDVVALPGGEVAVAGTYAEGAMTIGDDVLPMVPKGDFGIFLAVLDAEGSPRWGFGIADGGGGLPALAAGADGDVYLGGRFAGTIDLGQTILTAEGASDPFVARFDADGAVAWATALRGGGQAVVTDLEERAGELVVAGSFTTALVLGNGIELAASGEGGEGGGPSAPDVDGFVAALDADTGAALGAFGVGGPDLDTAQGVSGAGHVAAGDLAIVAPFVTSITIGEPHAGPAGFAVARLGDDGTPVWRRFVQTPDVFTSGLDVTDVAIGDGRVAVVGRVRGTWEHVDPDAAETTTLAQTAGDVDLLVMVWSASGELLWTRQLGDTTDQTWLFEQIGVAVDEDGGVTLAAGFRGEFDPSGQADAEADVVSSVQGDWLVSSWDQAGDLRWSRAFDATGGADGLTSAAFDPATGDLIVAGTTAAPLDVTDPPIAPTAGSVPAVVVARFAD